MEGTIEKLEALRAKRFEAEELTKRDNELGQELNELERENEDLVQ